MLDVRGQTAFRWSEVDFLFVGTEASSRWEPDAGWRDALLQSEARYYHRQGEHALLYAALHATMTASPDLDHQLLLGGDNGLRGYPLRYQSGESSVLVTAEQRFYTDWYPFRLFKVGAAVFADAGRTWGPDFAGQEPLGWLGDVGVGLRLGNARSGLGNVLHIDLAVPLVRQPDIDTVQLLIETRGSF
jgi:hemolysin activation/secretion protein